MQPRVSLMRIDNQCRFRKKLSKRSQSKRICFVTGHLKYALYVCAAEAAHLRHLSKRLPAVLYRYWLLLPREQVQSLRLKFTARCLFFSALHLQLLSKKTRKWGYMVYGFPASALSPQHSVLSTQSSALSPQHSVLNTQSSTLSPQHSVLNTQSSALSPQHSVLSTQSSALSPQH